MRYAIFSDIHANRQAWSAVLADMGECQVDVPVCLGDVVGYGPCPQQVLDEIREVTENFVMGNHDAAACGVLDPSMFNDTARAVIEWTSARLNPESKTFLKEMPMVITDGELMFVHAEIEEPGRFFYIENEEEAKDNFVHASHRITFVGHTHDPTIFAENEDGSVSRLKDVNRVLNDTTRYIVNVGSVGEPRNPEDIRARYVIFDSRTGELMFRRVEFDVEAYRADLQATGLMITPYFLTVIDSYRKAVEMAQKGVLMRDMRTLARGSALRNQSTKKIQMSVEKRPSMKRDLQPVYEPTPQSKKGLVLSILVLIFVISLIGFIFFGGTARPSWATGIAAMVSKEAEPEPVATTAVEVETVVLPPSNPPAGAAMETLRGNLSNGLIFYAPFDEASTRKVLLDRSGQNRHLKVSNSKAGVAGKSGKAVQFKKSGILSHPATLNPLKQVTVSFWIFADKAQVKKENPARIVEVPGYGVILYDNNKLIANLPVGKKPPLVNFPPNGKWNHVLVIADGSRVHLFLNGAKKFGKPRRLVSRKEIANASIKIGMGASRFKLDEVAIWNRALSAGERSAVIKLANQGQSLVEAEEQVDGSTHR